MPHYQEECCICGRTEYTNAANPIVAAGQMAQRGWVLGITAGPGESAVAFCPWEESQVLDLGLYTVRVTSSRRMR